MGSSARGIGGARPGIEETELAEQRALVEYRYQRLAPVGRAGEDGDAAADDSEEFVARIAAPEEHFVARHTADTGSGTQGLQCFRGERTEELGGLEDASLSHDNA